MNPIQKTMSYSQSQALHLPTKRPVQLALEKIIGCTGMLSRESASIQELRDRVSKMPNLEQAVEVIKTANQISLTVIIRLLSKKGDTADLDYLFELSLELGAKPVICYHTLIGNYIIHGKFNLALNLLSQAEEKRIADIFLYAQCMKSIMKRKSSNNYWSICEKIFLKFKAHYDVDSYSQNCDFSKMSTDIKDIYQGYIDYLMHHSRTLELNQICDELRDNWQVPPSWLDQIQPPPIKTARPLIQQIALPHQPSPKCNFKIGQSFQRQNAHKEAFKHFERAAEDGKEEAFYELAICYQKGFGTQKDDIQAVKWLQQAAAKGLSYAQYALGVHYQKGAGVALNAEKAFECYRDASSNGNLKGSLALARCYILASGTSQDLPKAKSLLATVSQADKESALYRDVCACLERACAPSKRKRDEPCMPPQKKVKLQASNTASAADNADFFLKPKEALEPLELDLNKTLEENSAILHALEMSHGNITDI